MDRRNLFWGLDSQLHFIRRNQSQRMFADLYERTCGRVLQTARKIVPKVVFSISEPDDYVQEGYRHLWDRLREYRWVCDCGIHFDTKRNFDGHGCCGKPRNTISQYATFVVCRRMKHYRSWHCATRRDQAKTVHGKLFLRQTIHGKLFSHPSKIDYRTPELLYRSKIAAGGIRDLLFLENDYKIKFAISSFLEGLDTRGMYSRGVELGYFPDHSYARSWMRKTRDSGAFAVYVETLR